jgi:hypothetical protein
MLQQYAVFREQRNGFRIAAADDGAYFFVDVFVQPQG